LRTYVQSGFGIVQKSAADNRQAKLTWCHNCGKDIYLIILP